MRNIFKYPNIKLRDHQGICVPAGPSFSRSGTTAVSLAGNKLIFKAPANAPGNDSKQGYECHKDPLLELQPEEITDWDNNPTGWLQNRISVRQYGFYGPWFTGRKGSFTLYVHVVQPANPAPSASFFHPAAFETGLASYLHKRFGQEYADLDTRFSAPDHWRPLNESEQKKLGADIPAVRFKVNTIPANVTDRKHILTFPISDKHIVIFECGYSHFFYADKERSISDEPMKALIEQIYASIQVELSDESQKMLDDVQSNSGALTLSKHFPPIDWKAFASSQSGETKQISETGKA